MTQEGIYFDQWDGGGNYIDVPYHLYLRGTDGEVRFAGSFATKEEAETASDNMIPIKMNGWSSFLYNRGA